MTRPPPSAFEVARAASKMTLFGSAKRFLVGSGTFVAIGGTILACSTPSGGPSESPSTMGSGGSSSFYGIPSTVDDPCDLPGADCTRPPPNVLFIVMDDVGLDLLSAYGIAPDAPPTPTLDNLADEGVLFTRAYALPWCSPTRAAVLTGRNAPRDYRIGRAVQAENATDVSLPLDAVTIPQMLDEHSPWTWSHAHIGKWHLTKLADGPADAPLRHGYQRFRGAIANPYQQHALDGRPQNYYDWERSVEGIVTRTNEYATSKMVDDANEVIAELTEPWFVWLAPFAAHDPYQAPPAHLHSSGDVSTADSPTLARAMVEALDTEIGRLLETMPAEVRENTMIVVMGDNGSPSGVATATRRGLPTKGTVYEDGIHVPLIITGPLIREPGRIHDGLVLAQDLFSTILDIAGVLRSNRPIEASAFSILPQLLDPSAESTRLGLSIEAFEPNGPGPYTSHQIMVFDGRFKLIADQSGNEHLFDLEGKMNEDSPLDPSAWTSEQAAAHRALKTELEAF